MKRRRVRRDQIDDRLDRLRGTRHDTGVFVVGFGVPGRVTVELLAGQVMVVPGGKVVSTASAVHRRERARQGQNLEAVLRQLQITDDLRA